VAGGINNLILSRLLLSSGSVTGSARLLGSPPLSAAFSRDGSLLASGAQNGGLFLYNTSNGGQVSYVRNVRIYDMNFSEDGKRLISAGGFSGQYDYAGVVRQWKVPTLEPLAVYSSETSQAFRVAYTPDGQNFLYGRWDGVLVYAAVRPFVRLSVTAQNGTVGQNVRLTALLKSRDGEAPLAGKSVTFYAVPASQPTPEAPLDIAIGTATTDANGVASLVYTIPEDVAANRVIMAQYAGDTDYDPGLGQAVLVASPLRTGLSVANPTARPKQTIGLRAVLRRAGGVPLVGRTLTYAIGTTTLGTAVTDATGTTSLPYTLDASATGTITFTVTYAGEASYQPVSGTGTITVTP
jgi:hypothetical protein